MLFAAVEIARYQSKVAQMAEESKIWGSNPTKFPNWMCFKKSEQIVECQTTTVESIYKKKSSAATNHKKIKISKCATSHYIRSNPLYDYMKRSKPLFKEVESII